MTGDERQRLRALVDQHQRARIHRARGKVCGRCGIPHLEYLIGCDTCSRRKRRRELG